MKKIMVNVLFFICLFILVGCYKEEDAICEFDGYEINDVRLSFEEITKETYDSKDIQNVLENRYFNKYNLVTFSMTIEKIEYNDTRFTEIPGSSNYNDRYYFM